MTRTEFIQQACISMAGKVIGTNGITDSGDWMHVVEEAEELAGEFIKAGYEFDKELDTTAAQLDFIARRLEKLIDCIKAK